MYLASGFWPGEILPRPEESDGMCGVCHERPAAWGDWMCSRCRAEFEAELRMDMGEDVDEGRNDPEEAW